MHRQISDVIGSDQQICAPYTLPMAVKLSQEECDLPDYISLPQKLGHRVALCQAMALVRRLGWSIK